MTRIFHITHLDNVPGIVASGCLWSDSERLARGLRVATIGHQHIKERRQRRAVPLAAGGVLGDYVPFYFAPRSPMLYSIHSGYVAGYRGGQELVLHLVADAEDAAQIGQPWCFTDGHAEMEMADFSDNLQDLPNFVDWKVMRSTFWNDTAEQPQRKFRRQAEFLVHRSFPIRLVHSIGVYGDEAKDGLRGMLKNADWNPAIQVRSAWYYSRRD